MLASLERHAQQNNRGHHSSADQPDGMGPAARAAIVDDAGDDHKLSNKARDQPID
jgi:hypothetical protein